MTVWTCSMYSGTTGQTFITSVFSDFLKAEKQPRVWLQGIGEKFEEIDRDQKPGCVTIYYQTTKTETPYTATLEEFNLDEYSY